MLLSCEGTSSAPLSYGLSYLLLRPSIVEYRTSRHNSHNTLSERTPLLANARALSPSRDSDTESIANGQVAPGNPPQTVVVQPATPTQKFASFQHGAAGLKSAGGGGLGVASPLRADHVHDEPDEFTHEDRQAQEDHHEESHGQQSRQENGDEGR